MDKLLDGQTAIVTGGTGGIGKAIALKFAANGAKVAIFGRDQKKGEETQAALQQLSPSSIFFSLDVTDGKAVQTAITSINETMGPIDILVNNAGITRDNLIIKMSDEDWDQVMAVNVKSCFNTCRYVSRLMIKRHKGKIINISSVVGLTGNAGQVNYAASKGAIIGFTKALAKELVSRKICVNCIAPGFIETSMTDVMTEHQKKLILNSIPLGRMGRAEEIASLALFLASSQADYITGQVYQVDGGLAI